MQEVTGSSVNDSEGGYASILQHLSDLKRRLLYAAIFFVLSFFVSYFFSEDIYQFLLKPLVKYNQFNNHKIIYTGLTEAFFTYMKLALFTAFFVSFPFTIGQIYIFIAPGLYKQEKMVLLPYLIAAPVLFFIGAVVVYYLVLPMAWEFFLSFENRSDNTAMPIHFEARVSEYLSIVMHFIVAFGLAFQMPILLTLLARVGLLSADYLIEKRKISIVIIFIIAAIITPPDVISQIALAIPMMILYELSVWSCKLISAKEKS